MYPIFFGVPNSQNRSARMHMQDPHASLIGSSTTDGHTALTLFLLNLSSKSRGLHEESPRETGGFRILNSIVERILGSLRR